MKEKYEKGRSVPGDAKLKNHGQGPLIFFPAKRVNKKEIDEIFSGKSEFSGRREKRKECVK